jgi:hypothetical protein
MNNRLEHRATWRFAWIAPLCRRREASPRLRAPLSRPSARATPLPMRADIFIHGRRLSPDRGHSVRQAIRNAGFFVFGLIVFVAMAFQNW